MLSVGDKDGIAGAAQKKPSRITFDDIEAQIDGVEFYRPAALPHLTIAVVVTKNGYALVGKSIPVDPENFDEGVGQRFAKDDAVRQLWPLLAYAARDGVLRDAG